MDDLELLTKWSNSPEIWYNLGGWHFPYSSLSTEEYIRNINNNMKFQNFAIETEEMGFIGTTNLVDIDWKTVQHLMALCWAIKIVEVKVMPSMLL